jgi:hypothetical protein
MRRIGLLALVALISIVVVLVILNWTGMNFAQVQSPQLEIAITDMMTGYDFMIETDTLKLIDPTVEFVPPISKVARCYSLQSSAPITVTYQWMYEGDLVLQRNALVESGLNCTTMQKRETTGTFPDGNYQVMVFTDGVMLARMSFVIHPPNKSG